MDTQTGFGGFASQQQQRSSEQPVTSQSGSGNYLPRFLLGGSTPQGSSHNLTPSRSHQTSVRRNRSNEKSTSKYSSYHRNPPWATSKNNNSGSSPFRSRGIGLRKDKSFGPPVESLYDDEDIVSNHGFQKQTPSNKQIFSRLDDSSLNGKRQESFLGPIAKQSAFNDSQTSEFIDSKKDSIYDSTSVLAQSSTIQTPSPAQIDPFYTQGEDIGSDDLFDECWVTVFGFPPSAATYILEQFSHYGVIVKHVIQANSNWMHIQYQLRIQAKKALSKSGRIFGNGIMVGVRPCIDKVAIITNKGESVSQSSNSLPSNIITPKATTGIRPLVANYAAINSQNKVAQGADTPQKSDGFVSKVMEYMFGW